VNIKQTSWKRAAAFLAVHSGVLKTQEPKPGVAMIVSLDMSLFPAFEKVEPTQEDEDDSGDDTPIATKVSSTPVTVCQRKIRNKNVICIDCLEFWGFSKKAMQSIAKDLRKEFSCSVSVSERIGTENSAQPKWTVQVQGTDTAGVAAALKQRGISKVNVRSPSGK
jgi:translation initiation factor 1 (eIF-1/SUI1)